MSDYPELESYLASIMPDLAQHDMFRARNPVLISQIQKLIATKPKELAQSSPFPAWDDVMAFQATFYDNWGSDLCPPKYHLPRWGVDVRAWTFVPQSKSEWAQPTWEATQRLWTATEAKAKCARKTQRKLKAPLPLHTVGDIETMAAEYDHVGVLERVYEKSHTQFFAGHYVGLSDPTSQPSMCLAFPGVVIHIEEWTTTLSNKVPLNKFAPKAVAQVRYSGETSLSAWTAGKASGFIRN